MSQGRRGFGFTVTGTLCFGQTAKFPPKYILWVSGLPREGMGKNLSPFLGLMDRLLLQAWRAVYIAQWCVQLHAELDDYLRGIQHAGRDAASCAYRCTQVCTHQPAGSSSEARRLIQSSDQKSRSQREVEGGKPYESFYKQILAQLPGNSSAGTVANSPKADTVWKHTRLALPESKKKFQGCSTVAKHACNGKFPSPSGHRRFLWFLNGDSEQRPGHTSPATLVLQALSK